MKIRQLNINLKRLMKKSHEMFPSLKVCTNVYIFSDYLKLEVLHRSI